MTRILLTHTYFMTYDPKQVQKMKPYPPLATLVVANHLRQSGHIVRLFDAMLSDGEHEFETALSAEQPDLVILYDDNFNFLSKMCLSRMREAALTMIGMARQHGAVVIVAGSDASDHPDVFLAAGAQAIAIGESDHTLVELAGRLSAGLPLVAPSVAGTAYRDEDGLCRTPPRPNEKHPDVFGLPAWDLVDIDRYRQVWQTAHGYFSLNMASTRGCPFHCNWCAKPIWGQRYAMRSPAQVASEMALVKHTLRPDHIWFADDIFGLRPEWVAEFGREVAARDASIPFMIQSRVDLMSPQAIAGLKQAGCAEVWLGAESGSQKILDAMDKGTQVQDIFEARARLMRAGIRACFFIQFGYPGETLDDIRLTVQMVRKALPDDIGVSVSYPLPGTKFFDLVRSQLGEKHHWTDSDDLAMMFQGTFQSPFYRKLHQVLHHDLDVHQRLAHRRLAHRRLAHRRQGQPDVDPDFRSCAGLHLDGQSQSYPSYPSLRADVSGLRQEWRELHALAQSCRNVAPTCLVKSSAPSAPDLSLPWN